MRVWFGGGVSMWLSLVCGWSGVEVCLPHNVCVCRRWMMALHSHGALILIRTLCLGGGRLQRDSNNRGSVTWHAERTDEQVCWSSFMCPSKWACAVGQGTFDWMLGVWSSEGRFWRRLAATFTSVCRTGGCPNYSPRANCGRPSQFSVARSLSVISAKLVFFL